MNDYIDIAAVISNLLHECGSLDIAEAEFRRMLLDDPDLRLQYRSWCIDNDTTESRGFSDYAEEYLQSRESVWDSLTDFDDNE